MPVTAKDVVLHFGADAGDLNRTIDQTQRNMQGSFSKMGSSISGIAKGIGTAILGIVGATVAVGAAIYKIGESFDDAYDTIRVNTGATGPLLEGLKDDFRAVIADVPTDFGSASEVVADLNTRLGLTGPPLQNLSAQLLNLSRITKSDINALIPSTTRVFGDWSIATDDQSKTLDWLFKVSQQTGIGVDALAQKVVQFGAPLRSMGFDFETSTALIGKWEQEGVNAELVLGSMRIALGKFAREGVTDTKAALLDLIDQIKNAGSTGESTALAMEYFGSRAGPDMAAAIREGRFELDELLTSLEKSPETINKAAEATMDMKEQFTLLKNNIMLAIEPLGTVLFSILGDVVKMLKDEIIPKIAEFAKSFEPLISKLVELIPILIGKLLPVLTKIFEAIMPVAEAVMNIFIKDILPPLLDLFTLLAEEVLPPLAEMFGEIVETVLPPLMELFSRFVKEILPPLIELFMKIIKVIMPPLEQLFKIFVETILPPLMDLLAIIVDTILPPLVDIFAELAETVLPPLLELFAKLVDAILPPLLEILTPILEAIMPLIEPLVQLIELILPPIIELIGYLVDYILKPLMEALAWLAKEIIPRVIGIFTDWEGTMQWLKDAMKNVADFFINIWNNIRDFFVNLWQNIKDAFMNAVNNIRDAIQSVFNFIRDGIIMPIWNAIRDFFTGIWENIKSIFFTAIETVRTTIESVWLWIKNTVETVWNGIRDFFVGIWDSIVEKVDLFRDKFMEVWNKIKEGIKIPINAIIRFINRLISGIESMINAVVHGLNKLHIKMPDWLGGKTFGFNLKEVSFGKIPELATGGYIERAGLVKVHKDETLYLPQGAEVKPAGSSIIIQGPLVQVEYLAIRSDSDIKLLSEQLYKRAAGSLKAKGVII